MGTDQSRPQRLDRTAPKRAAATAAAIAATYCVVVFVLLAVNLVQTRRRDPLNIAVIGELKETLRRHPGDEKLKETIRKLDYEGRSAFFAHNKFSTTGSWLLLGGVSTLLLTLQVLGRLSRRPPDPRQLPAETETEDPGALSRKAVAAGALLLLVAGLTVASDPKGKRFHAELQRQAASAPPETSPSAGEPSGPEAPEPDPTAVSDRDNWPCFRGPGGNGIAYVDTAPTAWDGAAAENVKWRTIVPKPGFSSPIVWGDRVFLTGGDEVAREVYCFDANTGALAWRREVTGIQGSPEEAPEVTEDTGYAAPTMATDGVRVFALFATGNLVCYDFAGKMLWGQNLGVPENHYGHSSSLMLHGHRLLAQYDHSGETVVLALDAATGTTLWETARDVTISWASPIVVDTGKRAELILTADPSVVAYDPVTGRVLWSAECMGGEVAPSPAYANGLVFAANEYASLVAIRTGTGTDQDGSVVWETQDDLPEVSSPLATDRFLFVAGSTGTATCYEAKTGTVLWQHEFTDGFYSSPILAAGRVYLCDMSGVMHIFRASDAFELVASPALGERYVSTPAFKGPHIYMRGMKSLYCIAMPAGDSATGADVGH